MSDSKVWSQISNSTVSAESDDSTFPPPDAERTAPNVVNTTFFNAKEFINFTKAFIGNPQYNVFNMPFILEANLTVTCFKTIPNLQSMTIKLTTIDCDDIYIFSTSDSQQMNSQFYQDNYNNELLAIKTNSDEKVKFLPQLIKDIYKSDDFYCLEWGQKQKLQFDLDLFNCDKFSMLFSPKPK